MITQDIIYKLSNDSALQSLFEVSSSAACPVFSEYNYDSTLEKQINVGYDMGETLELDDNKTSEGEISIYILVKDDVSQAINVLNSIAARVNDLLDMAGTNFSTSDTVYMIRKIDSDFTHYESIKFYELALTYKYTIAD